MRYISVRNWTQYQHYKDRNPPWIKLHRELLTSHTWVAADDASRVLAISIMMLAAATGNKIPADPAYIQRVAYLNKVPDFTFLINCQFIDISEELNGASSTLADASKFQASARPERETEGETKTEERRDIVISADAADLALAVEMYNQLADEKGLPKAQVLTASRKSSMRKRLAEAGGIEGWAYAISQIRSSAFLTGKNDRGWKANLDFMLQQKSFTKLMEGSYTNGKANKWDGFVGDTNGRF
jgi:hypothetical protein